MPAQASPTCIVVSAATGCPCCRLTSGHRSHRPQLTAKHSKRAWICLQNRWKSLDKWPLVVQQMVRKLGLRIMKERLCRKFRLPAFGQVSVHCASKKQFS